MLGQAVLEYLRRLEATRLKTTWDLLPETHRQLVELLWRYPKCRRSHLNTHHIFLVETHRLAAEKKFSQAGKNYRAWVDLDLAFQEGVDVRRLPQVKRKWSSVRANAGKLRVVITSAEARGEQTTFVDAIERGVDFVTLGEDVIHRAMRITSKPGRRALSMRELAQRIAEESGMSSESVRRIFKPDEDKRALSNLKKR